MAQSSRWSSLTPIYRSSAVKFFDLQKSMMLQEEVPRKTLVLGSMLLGFGLAALLSLPSARYTEDSAISMAATPSLVKQGSMQAYSPFNGKKYETLSYLPQLQNEDIRKQIEFMIRNKWTPCLEISGDGDIYLNTAMGPNYYDNRYW